MKHSPTHHPDHHPIFISFFHLPRSTASSLFKLCVWKSFCTTSLHVLFGLPLGLEPSTSYSIHLKNQIKNYADIEQVRSIRRCCHSNETYAPTANPPNSAQLEGTPYHSPKLHPGPCSSVGMRRGQTHRHM